MQKTKAEVARGPSGYFLFPDEDLAAGFALAFGFEAVFFAAGEPFLAGAEVFFAGFFLAGGVFFAEADVFFVPLAAELFDDVFFDAVRFEALDAFLPLTDSTAETVAPAAAPEAAPARTSPTTSLALS